MGIASLFGGAHIPVHKAVFLLHLSAQGVKDGDGACLDKSDLSILHIGNIPGVLDDGGNVRGDEAAALAIAKQKGRVLAGGNEAVGHVCAQDAQGVCSFDSVQHPVHSAHHVPGLFIIVLKKLGNDLRVRL